jgi:NAD(P)-dependent dehydrogenase (short-subunit alcohol dehydrogenase family)
MMAVALQASLSPPFADRTSSRSAGTIRPLRRRASSAPSWRRWSARWRLPRAQALGPTATLTRSAAMESAEKGVRINAVAPGRVVTDMMLASKIMDMSAVAAGLPLRRMGQPRDG